MYFDWLKIETSHPRSRMAGQTLFINSFNNALPHGGLFNLLWSHKDSGFFVPPQPARVAGKWFSST